MAFQCLYGEDEDACDESDYDSHKTRRHDLDTPVKPLKSRSSSKSIRTASQAVTACAFVQSGPAQRFSKYVLP